MITDKMVMDNILSCKDMGTLMQNLPNEHADYIKSFLDIPFLLDNERDREWAVYLYIVDTLKWYVAEENENKAAMDKAGRLLEILDTAFDHKPEYNVKRFYRS